MGEEAATGVTFEVFTEVASSEARPCGDVQGAPQPGLPAALLEAVQELDEIVAQIAAFLDRHRWQAGACDLRGHGVEARARHLQALQWIGFVGVEPIATTNASGATATRIFLVSIDRDEGTVASLVSLAAVTGLSQRALARQTAV